MKSADAAIVRRCVTALARTHWTQRGVLWAGGLFIAVFVALAALGIVHSYREAVADTGRDLDSNARVLAEQTARSVQAVDVVLRYMQAQLRHGALASLSAYELRAYLKDQAPGLVQIDGFLIVNADGSVRASSYIDSEREATVNVARTTTYEAVRAGPMPGVFIGEARRSELDGRWFFPMVARLETSSGEFAGAVSARGRIDYFQDFYRDVRLDSGTAIALLQDDGAVIARYPPVEKALGTRVPNFQADRAAYAASGSIPIRSVSPIDGIDRFVTIQSVPGYPLAVVVTRDAAVALSPWRAQAIDTVVRTLALGGLAALLLVVVSNQIGRLSAARERYALAVAGSDDGIWDFDLVTRRAFGSARAREILGLAPGPEVQSMEQWFDSFALHPEDAPRRQAAMDAHLAGRTPLYEEEYRVLQRDGSYRWVRMRGLCVRDEQGTPYRMAGSVSDVDARRRAEESLRESEQRYAMAMTASNEAHWMWNLATDELFASPLLKEIFHIPQDEVLATRTAFFARVPIHADDRPWVAGRWDEHIAGKADRLDVEYRIIDPGTGAIRWVHSRGQCSRAPDGRAERVAGVTVDITARKRTEDALRESEERFALAVAGSKDGVLDWDIVNDRMFTSERAMQIVGVPPGPTVRSRGEWVAMLRIHPEDKERHDAAIGRNLSGETDLRDEEHRILHPDGVYRWVRVRGMCVRDTTGQAIRWAGSVSDIDAQKRTEQALRQSEARYQLAVDGANQGLWDWDLETDIMFASLRIQELLGLVPSEPLRPRREWSSRMTFHPEDIGPVRSAISAHLHGKTRHFEVEFRLRHQSGSWHWYRQRGVALRDQQGRPYRMAGSMEDITEQKNAEHERRRLETQLVQAKKLESIGTLAGGIAHDFNNILAAILGNGEMAQTEAVAGTPLRRHVDAIVSAGTRAKSLVERILAFSRGGMGERVPVHVQSVVDEALQLLATSLPPDVRMHRQLDAAEACVMGDATQIHQVVMNLCTNAVQAMKAKGTLSIALDVLEHRAAMTATSRLAPGSYVRLRVSDTGTGIPANALERIFDPFFTTKDVGVGTGLGLSLVHRIVTDLGGGIEVESREGEGATFTIYLPWNSTLAASTGAEEVVPTGSGETVLLVDDEEPLVRVGEEVLARLGYEPVGFTSSAAALADFRASPARFHAVLSDQAMPDMNGVELAQELRSIRPDIPIMLMSGFVSTALLERARGIGVRDVLAKPLVARDIARSLAGALRT